MRFHRWANLTGPDLARIAARDPVALLPIAAIEQHGPHLPLSTDIIIGRGIIGAAAADLTHQSRTGDVLLMRCVAPGVSLEHTGLAGTLSLSFESMVAQLRAIGEAVAGAGIRRLVVFNSHGGNRAALDAAALQLRAGQGLLVVKANYFRWPVPAHTFSAEELAHGLHGGALETSMVLHLAPDRVRRDALADYPSSGAARARAGFAIGPEGEAAFAWMAQDLHPAGVTGDAAAADATIGARLVATFGQRLAEIVSEAARFDLTLFDRGH